MGDHRVRRATDPVAVAAVAVLLAGLTACGSDDPGESGGGPPGDISGTAPRSESGIIADWENACAVHDVEAIQEFMGIRALGVEPGAHEAGGGFSTDVQNCDAAAFDMPLWERPSALGGTETDDSLYGFMYLRVNYYEDADVFAEEYGIARDMWASGRVEGRHVVEDRTLEGAWDEGMLFLGSDTPDDYHSMRIVTGRIMDLGWSISAEINYTADPAQWHPDQQEQVYSFTDEELAGWVAETYLPQVHAAVVAAVGREG